MGDNDYVPAYLPQELLMKILLHLPVKSLIRFTCVCKSWLNLIKYDHQFAMKHYLTRTITSTSNVFNTVDCIFDITKSDHMCLYSFTERKTFRLQKKFECVPDLQVRACNFCHGIICFRLTTKSEILLCNPSIQEAVLLPPCPNKGNTISLGFDSINNNYKVIAFSFGEKVNNNNNNTGKVYSLREGQWRDLRVNVDVGCNAYVKGYAALNSNGRIHNWLGYRTQPRSTVLISFDMVEEVFNEVLMPECLHTNKHIHEVLSTSKWQACVSCVHKNLIELWVLRERNGDNCMWSKQFSVKCFNDGPKFPLNLWLSDEELLFEIKKGFVQEVFHYDRCTDELKTTGRRGSGSLRYSKGGYIESLISIKQFMSDRYNTFQLKDGCDYIFREVNRKGIQWSYSFKLV